jgi:hypothetical protein
MKLSTRKGGLYYKFTYEDYGIRWVVEKYQKFSICVSRIEYKGVIRDTHQKVPTKLLPEHVRHKFIRSLHKATARMGVLESWEGETYMARKADDLEYEIKEMFLDQEKNSRGERFRIAAISYNGKPPVLDIRTWWRDMESGRTTDGERNYRRLR